MACNQACFQVIELFYKLRPNLLLKNCLILNNWKMGFPLSIIISNFQYNKKFLLNLMLLSPYYFWFILITKSFYHALCHKENFVSKQIVRVGVKNRVSRVTPIFRQPIWSYEGSTEVKDNIIKKLHYFQFCQNSQKSIIQGDSLIVPH